MSGSTLLLLPLRWQAFNSQHIVGLFCPYSKSLLTLDLSTQAPKVEEMLIEMAGEDALKKPWNEGKTSRATADLIELAGVTSQIRRNKVLKYMYIYTI